MRSWIGPAVIVALATVVGAPLRCGADENGTSSAPRRREPIAAVLLADGQTLCVANRRSGTLSLVNWATGRVVSEMAVAVQIGSIARVPERDLVLLVDQVNDELIAARVTASSVHTLARLRVARAPVHVAVSPDGRWASVAGLWSHQATLVDLRGLEQSPPEMTVLCHVALNFAPRLQTFLGGLQQPLHVVVADSFGGKLAVIDVPRGVKKVQHALQGHNLRGMALTPDGRQLLIAHQRAHPLPTTRENIARGLLMQNLLTSLPVGALTSSAPVAQSRTWPLGKPGAGAGDPAGILPLDEGRALIALAGTQQVVKIQLQPDASGVEEIRRFAVGARPLTVVAGPEPESFAVLNTLDDSLHLFCSGERSPCVVRLGTPPRPLPGDEGERLFFDARRSVDGWMSCHSCHSEGHTSGELADTLGDGTYLTPKRSPTLFGTARTYRWAWNGRFANLHEQIQQSLSDSMHGPPPTAHELLAIAAFLHRLSVPPPHRPAEDSTEDRERIARGREVFDQYGCGACHIPPLVYTSHEAYDVGLRDERGHRLFNPPSLRGVSQQGRWLHHAGAASLAEVFTRFQHPSGVEIPAEELEDLLRFLESL